MHSDMTTGVCFCNALLYVLLIVAMLVPEQHYQEATHADPSRTLSMAMVQAKYADEQVIPCPSTLGDNNPSLCHAVLFFPFREQY